eukprot:425295-Amphidinium_carterae.1
MTPKHSKMCNVVGMLLPMSVQVYLKNAWWQHVTTMMLHSDLESVGRGKHHENATKRRSLEVRTTQQAGTQARLLVRLLRRMTSWSADQQL